VLAAFPPTLSAQHDHGNIGQGPAPAPTASAASPGTGPAPGGAGQVPAPASPAAARVELATSPAPVEARQPTELTLTLRHTGSGAPLTDLQVDHARLLHLVVVAEDLATFDHVHPLPHGDGVFRVTHTFPAAGSYRLYAEFSSGALGHQTVAIPLSVAGTPPPAVRLAPSGTTLDASGARVQLSLSPAAPRPGLPTQLRFDLSQGGQPVADLQPFLGVGGHLVAVSQDLHSFAHTHPSDTPSGGDHADHGASHAATGTRYGPTVPFTLTFQQPGLHKVWAQFNRDGDVITAPFVVEVSP
jgi:hypothetical protein